MTLTAAYAEDTSSEAKVQILKARLLDRSQPLAKRMRVVCSLRAVEGQGTVEALASCLDDESALLRHEVAYALGQKEETSAVPILIKTLRHDVDSMVRHEAAEALGAIRAPEAEAVLEEFERCDCEEVAHTCQLALDRIRWARMKAESGEGDKGKEGSKYLSIDPAPPADVMLSVDQHVERLMDSNMRLFERYGSLFALRDKNTKEAVKGLCKVLLEDKSSAVLRHEVAFVLGQMQNKGALDALTLSLEDLQENQMVRHEAAEAIGAIAEETATPLLHKFAKDTNRVVAESCEIALDISDYYTDETQFQYADVDFKPKEN